MSRSKRSEKHEMPPDGGIDRVPIASARACRELYETLESAPEHALPVEGHALGIHHVLHARVFHHLRVDAVAVLARVIENPRKRADLVLLQLHALRKRRELAR